MCGIAGILSQGAGAPPSQAELSAMIGSLRHRGPDGVGFYCRDEIGFAHSRLSIIDLASGDQPIHNEDRTVWVTFNGEIFNYVELRAELERKGHRFYTQSDTEVIVHLYEDHGEDFVAHLNGQFAIALWDSQRKRLVLARSCRHPAAVLHAAPRAAAVRLGDQGAARTARHGAPGRSAGIGRDLHVLGADRVALGVRRDRIAATRPSARRRGGPGHDASLLGLAVPVRHAGRPTQR